MALVVAQTLVECQEGVGVSGVVGQVVEFPGVGLEVEELRDADLGISD